MPKKPINQLFSWSSPLPSPPPQINTYTIIEKSKSALVIIETHDRLKGTEMIVLANKATSVTSHVMCLYRLLSRDTSDVCCAPSRVILLSACLWTRIRTQKRCCSRSVQWGSNLYVYFTNDKIALKTTDNQMRLEVGTESCGFPSLMQNR